MSDVNIFSDSDVNILRAMVRDFKNRVQNTRNRPAIELPEGQSPDVYVAHADSGIPAMTFGAGTGTGTGALAVDSPGSATCAVYRRSSTGLVSIGLNLTVYNYSVSAIQAGTWLIVARNKFGEWVIISQSQPSSGGGTTPTAVFSGMRRYCSNTSLAGINPVPAAPGSSGFVDFDTLSYEVPFAAYWDATDLGLVLPEDGLYLLGFCVVIDATSAEGYVGFSGAPNSGVGGVAYFVASDQPQSLAVSFEDLLVSGGVNSVELVTTGGAGTVTILGASVWIDKRSSGV